MPATFSSEWAPGARALLDGTPPTEVTVTALTFRASMRFPLVEVSWLSADRHLLTEWVEAWRLVQIEPPSGVKAYRRRAHLQAVP